MNKSLPVLLNATSTFENKKLLTVLSLNSTNITTPSLYSSNVTEKIIDLDELRKIARYEQTVENIWRIWSPVLLGKLQKIK